MFAFCFYTLIIAEDAWFSLLDDSGNSVRQAEKWKDFSKKRLTSDRNSIPLLIGAYCENMA
jgi:hypothetical protein